MPKRTTTRPSQAIDPDAITNPPKWLLAMAVRSPMVLWSERRWQREVMMALRRLGWTLAYHTWNSERSAAGFPDIVAFKSSHSAGIAPRFLVVELKRQDRKTTRAQDAWLDAFRTYGAECFVWRPSDWDECLAVLQ